LLHIQNAVWFLILTFKNDTKLGINQAENESRVIIKRKLKKYKLWKSPYFQAFFKHSKLIPAIKNDNLQNFV
jgi:hypothetical protein